MADYRYSKSNNSFYPYEMKESYESSGTWPDDGVDVTDEVFITYISNPPDGKVRGPDDKGMPSWVDIPPKSPEQLKQESEAKKTSLRQISDSEISWRQDAVDAEIATDEEISDLAAWKKYRVLLMRVDTSNPEWPLPPQ